MRPVTTESKSRAGKQQTKSMSNLQQIKRVTENLPSLRNQLIVQRTTRMSMKELAAKGRLHLGSVTKPALILTKEERSNPWAKRSTISEDVLNRKGLLTLFHMGVIAKQHDCQELLNNRYEVILKKQPDPPAPAPTPPPTFMTNPLIVDAYYELTKKTQQQEEKQEERLREEKAIRRRSSTKKKVVGREEPRVDFITEDPIRLSFLNYHLQHNEDYQRLLKKARRHGFDHLLRVYIGKVEQFTAKHGFKKILIVPCLDETRRTTDQSILSAIVNHRLLGLDMKVKGRGVEIFRWLLLGKLARMRYAQVERAIKRIERVKNTFKIKKLYRAMMAKRWQFVSFKLASFAENQRRLVADSLERGFRAEVEVHLLASEVGLQDLRTYYKWPERKKAQLSRLYSNEADHIILLLNQQDELSFLAEQIERMPSSWKKPKIHIFYISLGLANVQECADVYFGLQPHHIQEIKRICEGRNAVLIPFSISSFLPHLCETLGVSLFAGTFTEKSKALLQQDAEEEEGRDQSMNSQQLNAMHSSRLRQVTLANAYYQSKTRAKELFAQMKLPTPLWVGLKGRNEEDFFRELVRIILSAKQCSKWILKLPNSTFSRGLAVLETESLKIIKQARKKAFVREQDVEQIARIIQSILVQKVALPQGSLMAGDEFIALFKAQQGYVQAYLEGCVPVGVFGRIELNGVLTLLGSYRKYYAEGVCLGAMYPAKEVSGAGGEAVVRLVQQASSRLYQQGVFGYITFELLWMERSGDWMLIDLVPHLEQLSSFYFYYRRVLDMAELDAVRFSNTLKRTIFYCPFIDNNGNRFASAKQLEQALKDKKCQFDEAAIEGFKYLLMGQGEPKVVSLVCFGQDEAAVVRLCLQGLRFLVESGGQFNKFDKKYKNGQTDGLYIMDIIWKMRQVRKDQ